MKCEWCKIGFGSFLAILIVGIVSYQFITPPPPKTLKIATGKADGSYYKYGTIYHKILKKDKFDLQVIPSAGSVAALKMLEKKEVDVAFVQGGTAKKEDMKNLMSLGSIYFEPLWIFYSKKLDIKYLYQLRGKRLYIGGKGSGTRALAKVLLKQNRIDSSNTNFVNLNGENAENALKNGSIDALFMVISATSSKVKKLLYNKDIKLFSFKRAKAYSKRFNYLSPLVLGEGVISLEKNIPNHDITLLGTTATLVARRDLHPDLIRLILRAAKKVHSKASIFSSRGEFPTEKYTQIPMSEDAQIYLKKGDSFLQKIFPFWIASTIDRMIVMILPLLIMLLPLLKGFFPLYRWRIRSKIYKWYKILRKFDDRIENADTQELEQIKKELKILLNEIEKNSDIPLSYMGEYYDLKVHVNLILDKVRLPRILCKQLL